MVDEKLVQLAKMVYEWRKEARMEQVCVTTAEDSENAYVITAYDREGNFTSFVGACDD